MYYIVETKEQLKYLGKPESNQCFINVITTNDNRHSSLTKPCLVYYNDGNKGYILPIDHSEAFKLEWNDVKEFINSIDTVYVLDKKFHLYHLPGDNLVDLNFIKYTDETQFDTKVHIDFNRDKYYLNELSTLIPIPKHYEKWENVYNHLKNKFLFSDLYTLVPNKFLNDTCSKVFYEIEKNGIGIDPRKFNKHFEINWKNNSILGNTVYTQYNLYNLTTRPSNAFNGVNFAALPKGIARESFEPNNYVFVEFDYSAYHPRIIAKMIGYIFETGDPYDEIPKEIMFQNIYGGIKDEYAWFPFFTKLNEFLFNKYKSFAYSGSLQLACDKTIELDRNTHANRNKLLSYLIQSYETYYNVVTLERVLKLLEGKKSKIVLYTYDSILLDVAKEDIKILPKIKQELEADGFPTRMSIGENYGALVKK
jgi:hypothetical protein